MTATMADINNGYEQRFQANGHHKEIDLINRDPKQVNEDVVKVGYITSVCVHQIAKYGPIEVLSPRTGLGNALAFLCQ